ncbi:hypothetical protein NDU88_007476 [Pleurodeles waltl]|uniref:alpha-N-acetylgalactosaminide alpha-2,6-sialyltransferase n=2 Tax=Pleurodeles waltl TaxID=8319 RepID=A0AAV7PM17_PLEWA|nr:hypothetical protein NDU88_007476 [Pleurodeles waltl]
MEKAAESTEKAWVPEEEYAPEMEEQIIYLTDEAPAIKEGEPVKEELKDEDPIKKETIPKEKKMLAKKGETASVQKEAPAKNDELLSKKEDPHPIPKEATEEKHEVPPKKEAAPSKQEEATLNKAPGNKEEEQGKEMKDPAKKEEVATQKDEAPPILEKAPAIKDMGLSGKNEVLLKKEEISSIPKESPAKKVIQSKEEESPPKKEGELTKKEKSPSEQREIPAKKEEAPSNKDSVLPVVNGEPTKKEEAAATNNIFTEKKDDVAANNDEPQEKKEESLTIKEEVPAKKKGFPTSALKVPSATPIFPPNMNSSYLGDTYFQEDSYLYTTDCPSSMKKKMIGSDFRHTFMERLPLLQWAPHATPEEYARLRRYNGCFGWDVISWDYLKQTLSLLNTSANGYLFSDWNRKPKAGSPCIRCAVVGNGGILNGSEKGKEIDEHDYVFRVNGAVLDGFEEDVGHRTSFYFFSVNTMRNSLFFYQPAGFRHIPQSKNISYVFIPDNDRDYYMVKAALTRSPVDQGEEENELPSTFFGENYTSEQFKILHPDFLRYLRNRFLLSDTLGTTSRDIYRPSSGATMLLTAIHSCDEVSAYGFLTPDYQKYSDHYYDKTKQTVYFFLNHDYEIEKQLWQKLHKQGIITLYSKS